MFLKLSQHNESITTHIFPSAFSSESTKLSTSGAASLQTPPKESSPSHEPHRLPQGSLATFICRVAYLEKELGPTNTTFFDSDHGIRGTSTVQLGIDASFSAERGTLSSGSDVIGHSLNATSPKYITIKRVKGRPSAL